jgi:hypothetical protein
MLEKNPAENRMMQPLPFEVKLNGHYFALNQMLGDKLQGPNMDEIGLTTTLRESKINKLREG